MRSFGFCVSGRNTAPGDFSIGFCSRFLLRFLFLLDFLQYGSVGRILITLAVLCGTGSSIRHFGILVLALLYIGVPGRDVLIRYRLRRGVILMRPMCPSCVFRSVLCCACLRGKARSSAGRLGKISGDAGLCQCDLLKCVLRHGFTAYSAEFCAFHQDTPAFAAFFHIRYFLPFKI